MVLVVVVVVIVVLLVYLDAKRVEEYNTKSQGSRIFFWGDGEEETEEEESLDWFLAQCGF